MTWFEKYPKIFPLDETQTGIGVYPMLMIDEKTCRICLLKIIKRRDVNYEGLRTEIRNAKIVFGSGSPGSGAIWA